MKLRNSLKHNVFFAGVTFRQPVRLGKCNLGGGVTALRIGAVRRPDKEKAVLQDHG
jgi:hypothetical protein